MLIKTIVDYSDEILDEARRLQEEGIEYHRAFKAALKCYVDYLEKESPAPADQSKGTEQLIKKSM